MTSLKRIPTRKSGLFGDGLRNSQEDHKIRRVRTRKFDRLRPKCIEKVVERIRVAAASNSRWLMLVYELYISNGKMDYELVGVLPERRKNPTRITKESVIKWGRKLLGDDADSKEIFFNPISMESPTDVILWRDLADHSKKMS